MRTTGKCLRFRRDVIGWDETGMEHNVTLTKCFIEFIDDKGFRNYSGQRAKFRSPVPLRFDEETEAWLLAK